MLPLRATSNKDDFEFSDFPQTGINKRTRSRENEYIPSIQELSTNTYELSARDYTLSWRIRLYERLSTLFISINFFDYLKYI